MLQVYNFAFNLTMGGDGAAKFLILMCNCIKHFITTVVRNFMLLYRRDGALAVEH